MVGVEFDMVVTDSLGALKLYQEIFEIECLEATNMAQGENEVIFMLYGTRFHMLDQNEQFGLIAPTQDGVRATWFNILVEDIHEVFSKAMELGCTEIQALTIMSDYGVSTASFKDAYGYQWMLTEIHENKSLEERIEAYENSKKA